jgi:hypothetical protein
VNESVHPSSIELEAFACGEAIDGVEEHVGACEACRAFVDALARGTAEMTARGDLGDDAVAAMVRAAERRATGGEVVSLARARESKPTRATGWMTVLPIVAVAAGVLIWMKVAPGAGAGPGPVSMRDRGSPSAPASANAPATPGLGAAGQGAGDPETSFKGGAQVAVVRERGGRQERFVSTVVVRPGDRLRIEVALDRPGSILAGVLADDGTFLPLMAAATRGAGTHFSEQDARFDAEPTRGWVIAGSPDAIAKAKAARAPVPGVTAMRLEWEPR